MRILIGTSSDKAQGVYVCGFDEKTGGVGPAVLGAKVAFPSFLAVHPNGRWVYSVSEVGQFNGEKAGGVFGFRMDQRLDELTPINSQSSGGPGPCHLSVDPSGSMLMVANYGAGSVASFPIAADGAIGPRGGFDQHHGSSVDPKRQKGPHAHSIVPDPSGRFALSCDLGLDHLLIYQLQPSRGGLIAADPSFVPIRPGTGPRHVAFDPSGLHAYVITEMGNTITTFAWDSARGTLLEGKTVSTLPDGAEAGGSGAEVTVHPSGRFVYASNRGHNSIAVFAVDPASGELTRRGHTSSGGDWPRHFAIDPTGRFLIAANQRSNNLLVFAIDGRTGALTATPHRVEVPAPTCVRFMVTVGE